MVKQLQAEVQNYRIDKIRTEEEMREIKKEFSELNERFSSTFRDKEI